MAKGDWGKATGIFAQLLGKRPDDPILNYTVGAVSYMRGGYSEAESHLEKSIRLQPEQVAAYYYLALTSESTGQPDRAMTLLRHVLKDHPDHAAAHAKLGSILLRQRRYDEARHELERAVSLDRNSEQAHCGLALLLRRTGKPGLCPRPAVAAPRNVPGLASTVSRSQTEACVGASVQAPPAPTVFRTCRSSPASPADSGSAPWPLVACSPRASDASVLGPSL